MLALALYFTLAVGVSFVCSLLEAVILSVSHSWIGILRKEGLKSGELLHRLKSQIDRPLAAILTVNTVANTVGAAGVGAQAFRIWGEAWVALCSGGLTLVLLVCSEIIPKTLGAYYSKPLAPFAGYAINVLIILTYPAVILSDRLSRLLAKGKAPMRVTREEMIFLAEEGESSGALATKETLVIKNLVYLANIRVEDIMTPRSVLFALPMGSTVQEVWAAHQPIPFSRVPIYDQSVDDILGFAHRYRILEAVAQGRLDCRLAELAQSIVPILPGASVSHALDEFIRRGEHIFLVVTEYGGTIGIVTLEDAVETLLGVEIVDEYDTVADMRKLARTEWQRRKKEHRLENSKESGKEGPEKPDPEGKA